LAAGIISATEAEIVAAANVVRQEVIRVDDFDTDLSRGKSREEPWPQDSKKRIAAASM